MSYCTYCGNKLTSNAAFCSFCGAEVNSVDEDRKDRFTCNACGGIMNFNEDSDILSCPYCGAKEAIRKSDAVEVEKVRSRTYKEVEYKRWEREDEKERQQEEKKKLEEYKNSKLCTVALVFSIICGIMTILDFSTASFQHWNRFCSAFIALTQTLLFISAILMWKGIIKTKKQEMPTIVTVIGLLLIIPFAILCR